MSRLRIGYFITVLIVESITPFKVFYKKFEYLCNNVVHKLVDHWILHQRNLKNSYRLITINHL
jgi:hypothetical protein